MNENEIAIRLKRAMRAYSYNSINENLGLGNFKDLATGKAVMEISFNGDDLIFAPHKCPEPKVIIKHEEPRVVRTRKEEPEKFASAD